MGLFSKSTRDKDFDVEASAPPLVTATPMPVDYGMASFPTPVEARINNDIELTPLGRYPTTIAVCPHCSKTNVITKTSTYPSYETLLCMGGMVLIFWPLFWIPLVMDNAKKTDHICPNCGGVVGQVKPMSDCCVKERG